MQHGGVVAQAWACRQTHAREAHACHTTEDEVLGRHSKVAQSTMRWRHLPKSLTTCHAD